MQYISTIIYFIVAYGFGSILIKGLNNASNKLNDTMDDDKGLRALQAFLVAFMSFWWPVTLILLITTSFMGDNNNNENE